MSLTDSLEAIFDADRMLRTAEEELLSTKDMDALAALLSGATTEALALEDGDESEMRLERLADLSAQTPGAEAVDNLLRILDHPAASVRVIAGEALRDVAYERYTEAAHAIERAVAAGELNTALAEVPWVVLEVAEPDPAILLRKLLDASDPRVLASTIEALADLGDPAAADAVARFVDDPREVRLDDSEEDTSATLGELAGAALKVFEALSAGA
ncbi:MAG: hypothetical protein GXP55_24175 [Deltaproteobacteria bacterium]|nr:hypothetical protein [Deltaproteobacteria bacterium]